MFSHLETNILNIFLFYKTHTTHRHACTHTITQTDTCKCDTLKNYMTHDDVIFVNMIAGKSRKYSNIR